MVKVPAVEVEIYKRDEEGKIFSTTGSSLVGISSMDVRVGIENIKDVFSITLPNSLSGSTTWSNAMMAKNRIENLVNIGDLVKIKAYYETPDSNEINNILMVGEVNDFQYEDSNSQRITINGANITENILDGFTLTSKTVDQIDAVTPKIIIEAIDRLNQNRPIDRKVYAALDTEGINIGEYTNVTGSNGNIVGSNSLGQPFPQKSYSKTWQPVYKILEDLSGVEYTDDENAGNYISYVKVTPILPEYIAPLKLLYINELVFTYPSQIPNHVLEAGTDYSTITVGYDNGDVINHVIIKPGTDPEGVGITTYAINAESAAEHGLKSDFVNKPEIGNKVMSEERALGSSLGSAFSGYIPDGTYPWTFNYVYDRADEYPFTENSASPKVASNAAEYVSIMRDEISIRGKIEGQRIVDNFGEARYSVNVNLMNGSNNIAMGDLIGVQTLPGGWRGTTLNPNYVLRVRDIRHSFDNSGWNTTLVCVEDEKVISEKLNG